MFAYCGNNPVNNYDPTGTITNPTGLFSKYFAQTETGSGCCGGGGSSIVVGEAIASGLITTGISLLDRWFSRINKEVYQYSSMFRDLLTSIFANHQPRVHHIVPQGAFSNRRAGKYVREMQQILVDVGIDPATDPLNQIVVSQGYHKHLHSDLYMISLHCALKAVEGDREGVEEVLYWARIIIAAGDKYAIGY